MGPCLSQGLVLSRSSLKDRRHTVFDGAAMATGRDRDPVKIKCENSCKKSAAGASYRETRIPLWFAELVNETRAPDIFW